MNHKWQFKLDGEIHAILLEHTTDLKHFTIRHNGAVIASRGSKINPLDTTFTINSHFCIAQVRPAEGGYQYDLIVDGRSLAAQREKRQATAERAHHRASATQQPQTAAVLSPRVQAHLRETGLLNTTAPATDDIHAMSEAETIVSLDMLMKGDKAGQLAAARRTLANAKAHKSRPTHADEALSLPHSIRHERPAHDTHTLPYWLHGKLYEERPSGWSPDVVVPVPEAARGQAVGMPFWGWGFVAAFVGMIVVFLNGATVGVVAVMGAALCAFIASHERQPALYRISLCVVITLLCWGAVVALNGTLPL